MASANLANLLLARTAARDGEVAIRLALGGSRPALARQFLVECGVLAIGGATLGVVFAQALVRLLLWALSTTSDAPAIVLQLDWRVLGFTTAVTAATCLVFGLAPMRAPAGSRPAASRHARRVTGSRAGGDRARARDGADRAVARARRRRAPVRPQLPSPDDVRPRPAPRRGHGGDARLRASRFPRERLSDAQRELVAAIKTVPGVIEAGTTTTIPLLGLSGATASPWAASRTRPTSPGWVLATSTRWACASWKAAA